jgi:cytochrome c-type biogenesis protein CcmH
MILTLVGACIVSIAALIAVWLQVAYGREARGRKELHLADFSKRLAEIDVRLRDGKLKESEADAARIALLDQLRAAGQWRRFITSGLSLRNSALALVAMAGLALAAFTASTYDAGEPASGVGAQPEAASPALSPEESDAAALAFLKTYTRSLGNAPAPMSRPAEILPDVDTMIDRLAARLKDSPGDTAGWRMLGWSYFHTERYDEAAAAYAHAVELDPSSVEVKAAYEDAKAKSSNRDATSADEPAGAVAAMAKSGDPSPEVFKKADQMLPAEREAGIRSMVESLASRLEASPSDVEGWIRLIRSRVVLSEKEKAIASLRKALEIFKDDSENREKVVALAFELGLSGY